MVKYKLVSVVTRDVAQGQRIVLAHADTLTEGAVTKFHKSFDEIMTSKLIEVINRINNDPDNVSKLPKGLATDIYLLGAYTYRFDDESPVEDGVYDNLAKHLLANGFNPPITRYDLLAGTFLGVFPNFIARVAAILRG